MENFKGTSYQRRTARGNYGVYKRSALYNLNCAYGRHSSAKDRAWSYCVNLMHKVGGRKLKVLSHNSFIFTAGFEFDDPETGELKFMYITPNYDVAVDAF